MKKEKPDPTEGEPVASDASAHADVDPDEILPEYDFRGGVRGKYAARYAEGPNIVVLDPDVAEAFPDLAAVNAALRARSRSRAVRWAVGLRPRSAQHPLEADR